MDGFNLELLFYIFFRTSFVYLCFNILVCAISLAFYIMQFNNSHPETAIMYPELSTITVIYNRAQDETDPLMSRLIPGLAYLMIVLSSLISIVIMIYTSSRIVHRHPNYTMCLAALVLAIIALICPEHLFPSILDSRIVGSVIICAMTLDIISIVWVYGFKNLYTDLEFSIGRPILKTWIFFWVLTPLILVIILIWWAVTYVIGEPVIDYIPRWFPIVVSLAFIVILSCVEVSKQVDYNVFSMILEATRPSKDWGPADPLVRHSWKQWKSVCEDTGERDFTLRRRGTKDYTNSIKKGQYTHSAKYGTAQRKINSTVPIDTRGSNSPNYNGSVFGDSAIEEDMNSDKFNYRLPNGSTPSPGYSNSSRKSSVMNGGPPRRLYLEPKDARRQRRHSHSMDNNREPTYTSRIEIPSPEVPGARAIRNPMGRSESFQTRIVPPPVPPPPMEYYSSYGPNFQRNIYISGTDAASSVDSGAHSGGQHQPQRLSWRKATLKDEEHEFSTEL